MHNNVCNKEAKFKVYGKGSKMRLIFVNQDDHF